MTTDTDTAEALEAAIDAIACRRCDHDDPIGSTDRSALHRAITAHVEAEVARRLEAAPGVEAAIDNLRRVDRQSYASGGVESVWPARKALLAAIAADRARAVAEAVDLDAIALAADLIGRHLAPTSDVARGAVARLEAMLAGKPARPTPDEARRLLDEYDRATRHSYVTGGPEHLRAARAALLRALGVEA